MKEGTLDHLIIPHIIFLAAEANHNPDVVHKTYLGDNEDFTHGKVYEYRYMSYSPDRRLPRVDVLVTINDKGKHCVIERN